MKKGTKITLIVLGSLLGLGILVFVGADVALSYLAKKQVDKALAALPPEYGEASCGLIQVRLFSGTAAVSDINFTYRGESISKKDTTKRPGINIHVDRVDVGRFFYSTLLKHRILVSDIRVIRPDVELWLDDKHPETCFPEMPKDRKLDSVHKADNWLERAELLHFHLKNADFRMHSLRTKLDLQVDSCSLTANNLAYLAQDSSFSYNDSVYKFTLGHAKVMLPDGRMSLETNNLAHSDQGPLTLGRTRIANTMPKKKLGDIVKEPCTWIDMTIASAETSSFNPIHKAMNKDYTLESAKAVVAKMDVFRDTRYKPKEPFPTPQDVLLAIPVVFRLDKVNAEIKNLDIELASTDVNTGKLKLGGIKAEVENITNKKGETMTAQGTCPIENGMARAKVDFMMLKTSDFSLNIHATDIPVQFLNPFIRPLVGISMVCDVDTLDTEYTGNTTIATGTFRMLYHGFEAKVHKDDDVPYKVIKDNAAFFTSVANSLLPKSNPTAVDIYPREYKVEWKYDPWQPFPMYMFGPCINGAMKTFLPGLFVHEEVHPKRGKATKKEATPKEATKTTKKSK